MAKQTIEPKSKSSTAKKDAELRKLLDKPDFPSFNRMMKKLVGEREELGHLRRENQRLRMEREILKKATAFFAKESV